MNPYWLLAILGACSVLAAQSQAPVPLRAEDSGKVNLSGLAQAGHAAIPVALRLPVAGLAPGAYRAEFTVEDSAGGRAARDAEFRLE